MDRGGGGIPRRIAFINEKGGSGKTTLAANVAAFLALRRGRRVLAVDLDPQGQLGKVLGLDVREPGRSAIDLLLDAVLGEAGGPEALDVQRPRAAPCRKTRIPALDVVVANKALAIFPGWTDRVADVDPGDRTDRLAASLAAWPGLEDYDFVLFDAPPSFGPLTLNVLRASEEVVIPVPLTFLALDGCAELLRTVEMLRTRYAHDLRVSMVIPNFHRRTRMAREVLERLKKRFPKEIAHTVLGFHVALDEAQSRGLSIFEYAPRSRAAAAIAALSEELELRAEDPAPEEPT